MISLTNARDISNKAYKKASAVFSNKDLLSIEENMSTQQECNERIDEITPEHLALISTQAHAWVTVISSLIYCYRSKYCLFSLIIFR